MTALSLRPGAIKTEGSNANYLRYGAEAYPVHGTKLQVNTTTVEFSATYGVSVDCVVTLWAATGADLLFFNHCTPDRSRTCTLLSGDF